MKSKRAFILTFLLGLLVLCSFTAQAATPVAENGRLSIKGSQVVNEKGEPFVIKGVSTHGLAWYPGYVNKTAFKELRDKWGVNTIRLALYTAEYNGYCTGGNKKELKQLVENGVTYATELGMYVIIDWHILSDGNPLTHKSDSLTFFKDIAGKYAGQNNVLYEICNEPNGSGGTWTNIKSYAKEVIKTIRGVNDSAIIIVGTPNWSQEVDKANASKITGYSNIAYALHFYAGTHTDTLRNTMEEAVKSGLPVIVTEFGISDASGNGSLNKTQGNKWIKLLDQYHIGRVCWNLSNKNESSALIKSSCSKKYGWIYNDLSEQGKWLVGIYKGSLAGDTTPETETEQSAPQQPGLQNPQNPGTIGGQVQNPEKVTKSKTAKTKASSKVKMSATLKQTNSWISNGRHYAQYTMVVKNTGSRTSNSWTVSATFKRALKKSNTWCGRYTAKSKTLTIKPLSWNRKIKRKKSTELGFIISSAGAQSISSLKITAK